MKKILIAAALMVSISPGLCRAEEDDTYYGPWDDTDTPYVDNLGSLGTDTAAANIASESGGASGTEEGEITIFSDSVGIRVYSGANKVEMIPTGSDGWVGSYTVESGSITFQPAGRPSLTCPAQSSSGWFGPCKIPEVVENS